MQLQIPNMTCGGCANSILKVVRSIDPNAEVEADPVTRRVTIDPAEPQGRFVSTLSEAGYPPED
ncbi:heavy-metal-associated domain-containing protein [Aestuariicoccus sp. MJ-SS9]|uniref:heavy-metal-associated domain-containing protein n=1 Tax=Aestuariicoccus sp. MJ-SS9 TaxID=3079855 RepID=UPI0029093EDF|nr:heavy-metal-associated domain-containing protein [Aestuariicoccus sp. MJ-SS9]MDU8912262.1 heavy-metal-associated domain-containing protein [Aestuariicoccus sp. MJ-SS9]